MSNIPDNCNENDPDAPWNEVNYEVEYVVIISGNLTFSGPPNMSEEDLTESGRNKIREEFKNQLEDILSIEVYKE